MYWRVTRLEPNYLLRKWGVWIVVLIAVPLNVLQFATRPNLNKIVSTENKTTFDQFARNVTSQLLDSSYVNYEANTKALMSGELAPSVEQQLKATGALPQSFGNSEMQASSQQFKQTRRVVAVRIDDVIQGDPDDNGLVPIEVKGLVAIHSAEEGGQQEMPFDFKYLVGQNKQTQAPIIAGMSGI